MFCLLYTSLLCGWRYGLFIGFSLPLLRGMVFGMPIVYPTGLAMAFELATYGIVVGYLYERSHKQGIRALYCALLPAMVIGRVVWGLSLIHIFFDLYLKKTTSYIV